MGPASSTPLPSRKIGIVSRFLWACAGADASVLARCPHTDGVKYQGIGGVVLATAVLAFASGSYAFYTVFEPKTSTALDRELDLSTCIMAIVAGLVWALVIFNIDRFIVSSTGKGDGSERITLQEVMQSLPRLLMAVLIGVCISAPLEIRVLKPEIDAQLELEQNEYLSQLNQNTDGVFETTTDELRSRVVASMDRLDERERYFERRRIEINQQRRLLELEAEGRTGSRKSGRGPAWRDKRENLDQMLAELEHDRKRDAEKNEPVHAEIERWKVELSSVDDQIAAARASNLRQARSLDGLMKRIQISHEIGGWVPIFILLLLIAIETGPIFFKMMIRRGAYDHLVENEMRLATARAGIEADAQIYLADSDEEIRLDVYHEADAAFAEARRRLLAGAGEARARTRAVAEDGPLRTLDVRK
jgi:hypothetical protein